ncbi:MAG: hypothetical protein RRA92_08000 [Gemmatimonadota bacterium]|nr:hypothetical protein [Gemmatimonadota bacterium]
MLPILIAVTLAVAVLLGVLAKMEPRQIAAQCLAMSAAALVFWSLVELL